MIRYSSHMALQLSSQFIRSHKNYENDVHSWLCNFLNHRFVVEKEDVTMLMSYKKALDEGWIIIICLVLFNVRMRDG